MTVSPDRWTCPEPTCAQTVTPVAPHGSPMERALRHAQEQHGRRHGAEKRAEIEAAMKVVAAS